MSATKPYLRGGAILILWGSIERKSTDEEDLNDWWTNEHLPERLSIPGFKHARRYYSPGDSPSSSSLTSSTISKYLTWYEVSSLGTLTSDAYMAALNAPTPRTAQFMPMLASMNRSACTISSSVVRPELTVSKGGGIAGTVALVSLVLSSSADRDAFRSWVVDVLTPRVFAHSVTLAIHLIRHDDTASRTGSSSKSYEAVRFDQTSDPTTATPDRWILLAEFAEQSSAPFAKHPQLVRSVTGELESRDGVKDVAWQVYGLVCAVTE
jgi:hypothetical protein